MQDLRGVAARGTSEGIHDDRTAQQRNLGRFRVPIWATRRTNRICLERSLAAAGETLEPWPVPLRAQQVADRVAVVAGHDNLAWTSALYPTETTPPSAGFILAL